MANSTDELAPLDEERQLLLERERAARAEAESARRRLSFLAEASTVLGASLDYETTLASVARHSPSWPLNTSTVSPALSRNT